MKDDKSKIQSQKSRKITQEKSDYKQNCQTRTQNPQLFNKDINNETTKPKGRDMSLNKHRHKLQEAYGSKATAKNLLDKLKGLDASALPPCVSEITTHINRSAFVARMWANAHLKEIDQHPKLQDGWALQDDQ